MLFCNANHQSCKIDPCTSRLDPLGQAVNFNSIIGICKVDFNDVMKTLDWFKNSNSNDNIIINIYKIKGSIQDLIFILKFNLRFQF